MRQKYETFIKVISKIEHSHVFFLELRKTVITGNEKEAITVSEDNAPRASALERHSGIHDEARNSRDTAQHRMSKRKAQTISNTDYPSDEPVAALCQGICAVTDAAGNSVRPSLGWRMLR
jgi:hypothetical protein